MTQVRSRMFCCCLPVRFGVIVLALLGLFGGAVGAVAGVWTLRDQPGTSKPASVVEIIIYALLTLLSLFGLIGAIARKRVLVLVYFAMLITHLILSVASGSYSLYRIFEDAPATLQDCLQGQAERASVDTCTKGIQILKGVTTTIYIVIWLLEIWGCIIVDSYVKQLKEEEEANLKDFDSESNSSQTHLK